MPVVYNLAATSCPAPQTPVSAFYASASPPAPVGVTAFAEGPAGAQGAVDLLNADQARLNLTTRYGCGYGVWHGLDLTDGGALVLDISAGSAGADTAAEKKTAATLALTDNVTNYVWISRTGTINSVSSSSGTPLAPPDTATQWVYLGAAVTSGGSITSIDYSGRIQLDQGNLLWRRTADVGVPADTPPSTVRLLTRTAGGLFLWDGLAYWRLMPTGALALALSDANTTLTAAQSLYQVLTFTGTLTATRDVVMPNINGFMWFVVNGSDHSLVFKVSGQTGTTVATGKSAWIRGDGTDTVRATADV